MTFCSIGVVQCLPLTVKSFENYQLTFVPEGISVRDFFKEFSGFVDFIATNNGRLLILGDFNIP